MTTINGSSTNACIFQWKIENISHCCWLRKGVGLVSPTFVENTDYGTKWSLRLYPMGGERFDDSIGLYLHREDDDIGYEFLINYHLAFLSKDGSVLKGLHGEMSFKTGKEDRRQNIESQKRVFLTQRKEFLPEDALTIQCTLRVITDQFSCRYKGGYNLTYGRTVFKLNRRNVLWKIDKYSMVKSSLRNKFMDNLIDLDLILNFDIFNVNVISYDDSIKYISINISIIDSEGRKAHCGVGEFNLRKISQSIYGSTLVEYGKFEHIFFISCIPEKLMKRKSLYMPNDVLFLSIEYVYSTTVDSYDCFDLDTISPTLTKEVSENVNEQYVGIQKSGNASVLINDLKSMYIDGIFSDTELHTSSQTFLVHKGILSARSPVFSRMFSHGMNEKNSGHVYITDMENDTVHRMLLYLYTDSLEGLQFESASKLYVAADKYEILSLRSRCSSYLKDNMCPTKACDVLVLADSHQDEGLKSFVQAYIFQHDEIFGLQKWKNLMENNLKLAADIMYRKLHPCIN